MGTLLTDLRYALRQVARAPGFTLVAVFTLALGIGANSALFTVADSILRRPRPGVGESSMLLWVASTSRERSRPVGLSLQVAERLRQEVPLFERVVTVRDLPLSLVGSGGEPRRVKGQAVNGGYFTQLRAGFAMGRGFTSAEETSPAPQPVAVLNHATWSTAFGGDPAIVGKAITVNGHMLTVVGVTAPGFNGAEHDEEARALWMPSSMIGTLLPDWQSMVDDPASSNFRVLARLRGPGDRAQAAAAVGRIGAALAVADTARPAGFALQLYDASAGIPAGGETQLLPLAVLATAVTGLILLICCANVSNLMLARALGRRREIATRLSIGASRARVVRQLLAESLLLAVIAGAAGLLLAAWGGDLVIASVLPIPLDLSLDGSVVATSAALALGTTVLVGLAPALHATRDGVATALRAAGGGASRRSRLQGMLVAAQIALSLLLLTTSGLFLRSLDTAQRVDVGFDASDRILAVSVDARLLQYDSARTRRLADQVIERASALPGVERATLTTLLPLTEWTGGGIRSQRAEGAPLTAPLVASISSVRPGYFSTLGIALVTGRDFGADDAPGAPRVAIVSESFATRAFGTTDVLGARVGASDDRATWATIIGVSRDAVVQSLQAPSVPAVYFAHLQGGSATMTFLLRRRDASAEPLAPAMRDVLHDLDPALPIYRVVTMARVRQDATAEQRAGAALLAAFGGLALLLAALGVHAVMTFSVRQRWRELGIRVALGASRRAVTALVLRRGMQLAAIGVVAGLALSLGAAQLLRSMLFGIAPTDAVTFVLVTLLLLGVAVLSSWWPARRAARVDPVSAMRSE
ncbi:MAG: ABC transporter permease [Gemmatimonadaceae bacterium]|nr:ABC transporter permease [Gemmatimonadaceae bacterium]